MEAKYKWDTMLSQHNQVITQASVDVMTRCQLILGQDKLMIDVVAAYGATH